MQIDDRRPHATASTPVVDRDALRVRLPMVRDLSAAHQAIVMEAGEVQRHRAGSVFCATRREQEWVYFLLEGRVTTESPDRIARDHEAQPGGACDCFHGPGQRAARARAGTDVLVFRIPQTTLGRFVNLANVHAAALPDVVELVAEDAADGLELALSIGVLARLPPSTIQRLLQRAEEVPVRAGETILEQGEAGDACYIVKTGVAELEVERLGGAQHRVSLMGPGEFFGEESLLAGVGRAATVRMQTDGALIRIDKQDFARLLAPAFLRPLARERAEALVAEGAAWLDMREPAEFEQGSVMHAINMPLAILRLNCTSLDPRRRYVVCSGDPGYSALGNFMLSAAGLEAYYLNEGLDRLEKTTRLDLADMVEQALAPTAAEGGPATVAPPGVDVFDVTVPDGTRAEEALRIGLEDVRSAERQRYRRRLRKAVAQLRAEADARVRQAVQEVEMTYLTELENKHRQVLDLKRKVAQQQRELWKLQRASLKAAQAGGDPPPAATPDES